MGGSIFMKNQNGKKVNKMKAIFKLETNNGTIVQVCELCKKYKSPVVTNGKPEVISSGMILHLMKSHNLYRNDKGEFIKIKAG